jgi:hypothetical protein
LDSRRCDLDVKAPLNHAFQSIQCGLTQKSGQIVASMSLAPYEASGARNPVPALTSPISGARLVGSHEQVIRSKLLPHLLTNRLRQAPDPDSKEASDDENVHLKESSRDSKATAMNRKRIVIKPIADERSRVGTYNKRKFGVIKKAMELSILCKCKIGTVNRSCCLHNALNFTS